MRVPAGATVTVPVSVVARPDAWAGVPVRVTVRARDGSGAQATAFTEITPTQDAGPVDPVAAWSVPDALLGGLDVASPAVGGARSRRTTLDRGAAVRRAGRHRRRLQWSRSGDKPVELTVDLAGDAPVPVAGIILDPLGGDGTLAAAPRAVDLLLSADGVDYPDGAGRAR